MVARLPAASSFWTARPHWHPSPSIRPAWLPIRSSYPMDRTPLRLSTPGDVNNLGSTSTALLQSVSGGLNFSISANPTLLSLSAGQSLPVTLSVFSSDGFTGVVTFKCTGLPAGSTCSFNPATITGNATSVAQSTTLTIGLPAASSSLAPAPSDNRYLAGFFVLPGGVLGICLLWQRRRLQRTLGMCILATIFLVSVSIGCAASSGVPTQTPIPVRLEATMR